MTRNGKRNNGQHSQQTNQPIRCATYCRKSTEEGLDSDFNSLDAQREAAEAYIASQKSEGWIALPNRYDDGGFSGGNLERPALSRLLDDIQAGKVNCVVVYKVDRLSRSLIDFSRIIDMLDKNNVSFVSVTQQFNTSNSMGRLTLNILLSFAQFEREIIAERTRDKMCAARRKGKWIGGIPMLGYDIAPKGGKLLLNLEEANRVREIFQLYLQYKSLTSLAQELNSLGWTTKSWVRRNGISRYGKPFTKTNLHSLLTNIIYLGKVEHQEEVYQGEHEAIIDETTWNRVQQVLENNSLIRDSRPRNSHGALLRGLVVCGSCGKSMNHTYTKRGRRLYRYYVCDTAQKQGYKSCPTKSITAHTIEGFVVERIKEIGLEINRQKLLPADTLVSEKELQAALGLFDPVWNVLFPNEQARILNLLIDKVIYDGEKETVTIQFDPAGIKTLAEEASCPESPTTDCQPDKQLTGDHRHA